MQHLDHTCCCIGAVIDLPYRLRGEEDEHRADLLSLTPYDVMCDLVEQWCVGAHRIAKSILEEFHFPLYGRFDLIDYGHMVKVVLHL